MAFTSRSKLILLGIFLFFYIPICYYWGFLLMNGILYDFPSFYHAARIAFVEGNSPYGMYAFDAIGVAMHRKVNPYLYPPPSLIAFWPLAHLTIEQAQAVFLIVSHLCFLGSLWLILAQLTPLPRGRPLRDIIVGISLVYILNFDPAVKTLALGQVNFIALFFVCLTMAALRRGSAAWRVALPLSVAILLKTYPVLLLVPLFFRKRFQAIALTCAFYGGFAIIAAAALPGMVWVSWFYQVLPMGGYANNDISAAFAWNQSINAFVTRLLISSEFNVAPLSIPSLAKPLATALAVLVLCVTAFFSFRLSRRGNYERSGDDEIAAYLLTIFLIAPLSWDHHLVYILPAAVLSIDYLLIESTQRKAAVMVLAALFLVAWPVPLNDPAWLRGWWTLLMSLKFYAACALWLFFIDRLRTASAPGDHREKPFFVDHRDAQGTRLIQF